MKVRFWYSAEVLRKRVSDIALKFDVLQSEEHCIGSFCCRMSYILSCSVLPYLTSISNALSLLQICEAKAIIMCRCKGELLPVDETKTRSPMCYGVWGGYNTLQPCKLQKVSLASGPLAPPIATVSERSDKADVVCMNRGPSAGSNGS